jgi:hypothetical protein
MFKKLSDDQLPLYLNLALDMDLPFLIPAIYLRFIMTRDMGSMCGSIDRIDALRAAVNGRTAITRSLHDNIYSSLTVDDECDGDSDCLARRLRCLRTETYVQGAMRDLFQPSERFYEDLEHEYVLCEDCMQHCKANYPEDRYALWGCLPGYFGYGRKWEPLEKQLESGKRPSFRRLALRKAQSLSQNYLNR